jgi:cytochrome P450
MVSFSSGVHTCLGHFLARMELFELYKALLERTTRIDVADARFRKDRQAAFGMDTLNLTVT